MLINEIKLHNYRNYSNITIPLHPTLNIIVGPNGIGKTNILESVIVTSNTKSFRTLNDRELIQKEKEFSRIEIDSDVGKLKIVINQTGKSLFINDNSINKTSEYIGKLNAILFKPSDLELFNQSPKERRKLLDIELGKISKDYLLSLVTYNKLLKDKNKLLKENHIDQDYLDLIDEQMIPHIIKIINLREEFFRNINLWISNIYQAVSDSNTKIEIVYKKCCNQEEVKEKLFNSKEKDNFYHYATFGPHHDDYYFKFNNDELNSVASQGQKRMVFISFKFALIKYIQLITNTTPVILLDDVLSELDLNNQSRLLRMLPKKAQIIITDTDINGIQMIKDYNLIELKEKKNA